MRKLGACAREEHEHHGPRHVYVLYRENFVREHHGTLHEWNAGNQEQSANRRTTALRACDAQEFRLRRGPGCAGSIDTDIRPGDEGGTLKTCRTRVPMNLRTSTGVQLLLSNERAARRDTACPAFASDILRCAPRVLYLHIGPFAWSGYVFCQLCCEVCATHNTFYMETSHLGLHGPE